MTCPPPPGDRRKEPRYETNAEITIVIGGETHSGSMHNLSGGGMEIQLSKAVSPATNTTVSLYLHHEFIFNGVVIWTLGDYIEKRWIYRVGIKTNSISYKNQKTTDPKEKRELVQRLLPAIRKLSETETTKIENTG